MKNWILVKLLIATLRKINKKQKLGLYLDEILDQKLGVKRSEKVQEEICKIMEKIIKQLRSDRKE